MSLAQRVRDHRYSKGWGPDELASRAEISRTALYQIESGKTELPRAGTLRRIAQALDVSMDSLLGHAESAVKNGHTSYAGSSASRRPLSSEWYPSEGGAMTTAVAPRAALQYETHEGHGFVAEHSTIELNPSGREQELSMKLRDLLASPFGEAVATILEETHRLLP